MYRRRGCPRRTSLSSPPIPVTGASFSLPTILQSSPSPVRPAPPPGPTSSPSTPVCPSDPAKPLLEPEALQLTNTAFNDTTVPQAQSRFNGTGVEVAFMADGIDINNPDFIRPDGGHVFVDYQD